MVRSSPLANGEPPSLVPQRTEALHSRTRHVGGSAGVARQRREAWPGDHPSLGKLLQTQLAPRAGPWLSVPWSPWSLLWMVLLTGWVRKGLQRKVRFIAII